MCHRDRSKYPTTIIHARCDSPVGFLISPGPYPERVSLCTFAQMLHRIAHILATSSLICVLVPVRSSAVGWRNARRLGFDCLFARARGDNYFRHRQPDGTTALYETDVVSSCSCT